MISLYQEDLAYIHATATALGARSSAEIVRVLKSARSRSGVWWMWVRCGSVDGGVDGGWI
jgi:hypothetical protein